MKANEPSVHIEETPDPSKKSISSDNPSSDAQEHSSAKTSSSNSENQKIAGTFIQNNDDQRSSNEKIDSMVNVVIRAPVMLPPNLSIAQQPANIMLSPLQTTVNIC